MENQLKRHRSKRSRGPVCLRANSQALGKLIWAEWNTNTLFMEIRPINRQSSRFKEPSAGLAIKVFCSPLSSSLAAFLSGKTRDDKKVLLVGLERDESLSFVFRVSNTYGLKVFVTTVVPWGAKVFPLSFSKFFLIPSFPFFHPCHELFHSCCQVARSCSDIETLAHLDFCSAPLYHIFISLESQGLQDSFHSTTVYFDGVSPAWSPA